MRHANSGAGYLLHNYLLLLYEECENVAIKFPICDSSDINYVICLTNVKCKSLRAKVLHRYELWKYYFHITPIIINDKKPILEYSRQSLKESRKFLFPISSIPIILSKSFHINLIVTVAHKRDIFLSLRIDVPPLYQ